MHEVAAAAQVETDLSTRVPERGTTDEVDTLAHELNRMLDRLSDDADRRTALLAAISHELRTPLAVARGHVEVFRNLDAQPGSTAAATAATIDSELTRIGRIVDDLSALGRGHLGQEVEVGPVFVPDVLADLRERVDALGLEDVTIERGPPAVVEADADRLAQSLLNLVLNACAHTPAGTTVQVYADATSTEVQMIVADNGPGIDPSIRATVLDPFVTTRTNGNRRTGLGLAVVKALTEAQNGTLDLDTGTAGTTVTLRLPVPQTGGR